MKRYIFTLIWALFGVKMHRMKNVQQVLEDHARRTIEEQNQLRAKLQDVYRALEQSREAGQYAHALLWSLAHSQPLQKIDIPIGVLRSYNGACELRITDDQSHIHLIAKRGN